MRIKNLFQKLGLSFSDWSLIFILILIAAFLRLLLLPVPFIVNVADASGYVQLADIFLKGIRSLSLVEFVDTYIYRTPTYPIFLAVVKLFFGRHYLLGFSLAQHVFGILVVIITYLLSKRVFGGNKLVSFTSAFLVAVNPHQLYWEHNAMTEFFSTFLLVLSTFYLVRAWQEERFSLFSLSGLLFGLTILCRPVFQAVWVFIPLILLLQIRDFKKAFRASLYFLLPLLLIVSIWLFKNYFRHGFFGLTTLLGPSAMNRVEDYTDFNSGVHLKDKEIYKEAYKEYRIDQGGRAVFPAWFRTQRDLGRREGEASKIFFDIFLESVRNNPRRFLGETFDEIDQMLFGKVVLDLVSDVDLSPSFRKIYQEKLIYGDFAVTLHDNILRSLSVPFSMPVIFGLSLLGALISLIRKNWAGVLFVWFILYLVLVTTLIGPGLYRYRLPIEPFIFMLGSYSFFTFILV